MTSLRAAAVALALVFLGTACDSARTLESASAGGCTACHGAPPPPFVTGATAHPSSTQCFVCHSSTVEADGSLVAGGTHLNGTVEVTSHPLPWIAEHTGPALADLGSCATCHGADYGGGVVGRSCNGCHETFGFADWRTNCTFCHGTRTEGFTAPPSLAAPPEAVHGETLASDPRVGAHQKHLGNGSTISDGVGCAECHAVPGDLAHLDGTAQVAFGALATQGGLPSLYSGGTCSSTYCHGTTLAGGAATVPSWTGSVACGACHGSPPDTGKHTRPAHVNQTCARCHLEVGANTSPPAIAGTATARALHVNGAKDVKLSSGTWDAAARTCSGVSCHGGGVRSW